MNKYNASVMSQPITIGGEGSFILFAKDKIISSHLIQHHCNCIHLVKTFICKKRQEERKWQRSLLSVLAPVYILWDGEDSTFFKGAVSLLFFCQKMKNALGLIMMM